MSWKKQGQSDIAKMHRTTGVTPNSGAPSLTSCSEVATGASSSPSSPSLHRLRLKPRTPDAAYNASTFSPCGCTPPRNEAGEPVTRPTAGILAMQICATSLTRHISDRMDSREGRHTLEGHWTFAVKRKWGCRLWASTEPEPDEPTDSDCREGSRSPFTGPIAISPIQGECSIPRRDSRSQRHSRYP